jgi:hypothetical protein
MKNLLFTVFLFVSSLVFSQNTYWYDVLLEVKAENTENVASLVDGYYSSIDIPENVSVAFSSIPLKGSSEKATHIISIVADSSNSLADFRNSLSGSAWDLYLKVDGLVEVGQIVHGADNGENMYIYGTYENLSQAFDFGPKNDKEAKSFSLFNQEISKEDYVKTFTRVLVKSFLLNHNISSSFNSITLIVLNGYRLIRFR